MPISEEEKAGLDFAQTILLVEHMKSYETLFDNKNTWTNWFCIPLRAVGI